MILIVLGLISWLSKPSRYEKAVEKKIDELIKEI